MNTSVETASRTRYILAQGFTQRALKDSVEFSRLALDGQTISSLIVDGEAILAGRCLTSPWNLEIASLLAPSPIFVLTIVSLSKAKFVFRYISDNKEQDPSE
jgi:hypothetical protein